MREGEAFDYIVVGAGTAGCVLAARLSEDAACRVLLLEAGGEVNDPLIAAPGAAKEFWDSEIDWAFRSEPQRHLNRRRILLNRGKCIGGSGTLNWCAYVRGNRGDYDHWAQLGCSGWGYDDVLPYFRKSECNAEHDDDWHGTDGPLHVAAFNGRHPLHELYFEALDDLGVSPNADFNGAVQEGYGYHQGTLRGGRRFSTADGFLASALSRPNLTVESWAHVTGLVIEGGQATGVDYVKGREARHVRATSEVLLAAGAIGSPHILLLSGVGPADEIAAHGLSPIHDLPGVGRSLRDHLARPALDIAVKDPEALGLGAALPDRKTAEALFAMYASGPLATMQIEAGAFVRLRESDAFPNAQLFCGVSNAERFRGLTPGLSVWGYVCRPESTGTVRLATGSPFDRPRIDPNYFDVIDDVNRSVEIVEFCQEIAHHRAFSGVRAEVRGAFETRDSIIAEAREVASTCWHYTSTCRMGIDADAVVGPDLRVRGIDNLRVCDASIMPTMVSGNTNAATIMIAEKAADLVLGHDMP
ncbi:GMC family oxidoreductase [Ruegeria marina]|uniref:Choline dehydrogenase n=1 Tax=Ruegeria marina TaxID=639004 RepID=A0A1G6VD95_9RHOB|nr:GMC family oxidoreductase N-terminal domain-containing protein [Ruegeria marina]SDD51680.1 choline dehydrogenase [Ruegeria marina]